MKHRIKAWLPQPENVRNHRWLRWLGPRLHHPRLWQLSRKGIALGLALGIFFGLLVPVAQIPLSAAAAVVLRANLPMAITSTLVTNPVTFGPVYFAAYQTGRRVLGEPAASASAQVRLSTEPALAERGDAGWQAKLAASWDWLTDAGKPLVVGLAIFACVGGLVAYALTSLVWAWHIRRSRARRLQQRRMPAT